MSLNEENKKEDTSSLSRLGKKGIENFFAGRFKGFRQGGVVLRVRENGKNAPRFAFIVSSAVKKNAVARNLTRRRMAEIAREVRPKIKRGLDLVFSFKLSGKSAPSFKILKSDMIKLLNLCGAL